VLIQKKFRQELKKPLGSGWIMSKNKRKQTTRIRLLVFDMFLLYS